MYWAAGPRCQYEQEILPFSPLCWCAAVSQLEALSAGWFPASSSPLISTVLWALGLLQSSSQPLYLLLLWRICLREAHSLSRFFRISSASFICLFISKQDFTHLSKLFCRVKRFWWRESVAMSLFSISSVVFRWWACNSPWVDESSFCREMFSCSCSFFHCRSSSGIVILAVVPSSCVFGWLWSACFLTSSDKPLAKQRNKKTHFKILKTMTICSLGNRFCQKTFYIRELVQFRT